MNTSQISCQEHPTLAELLSLRFQWEESVRRYKFPEESLYHGTINSLEWFKENGRSSNRLRRNFKKTMALTEELLRKI